MRQDDGEQIIYRSCRDVTPEGELNALAACYAFILQRHQEKQEGVAATAPHARKESNGSDEATIPKQK
jgi:hypothetical protein